MKQGIIHNQNYGSVVEVNNFREERSLKPASEVDLELFSSHLLPENRIFVR